MNRFAERDILRMEVAATEKSLRTTVTKLYQEYDRSTDEYDKLFAIIDNLREEYYNSKTYHMWKRYGEWRRVIKNAVRKWRNVERRVNIANYAKNLGASGKIKGSAGSRGELSENLNMRIKAQTNNVTRDLYEEGRRLEKEIFDYRGRNRQIKDAMAKLSSDYNASKSHSLHIYGRYKELHSMIKQALQTDV